MAIPLTVIVFLSTASFLAAQESAGRQETESQRIYRQAYEAAMADSVISPDELQMLKSLQQALGLHEDIIDEAVGEAVRPIVPSRIQVGRWTLVAQNMGWGLGLYGWGIPYVLHVENYKWYLGGEMLSLGATFYLTWKYTKNMDLPEARSHMQRYGSTVGLQYGRALNILLGFWDNEELDREELLVLMGAVPAGIYLGDRLYRRWQPSTGMAYALSLYGELSASVLRMLHQQMDPEPKESDYETDVDYNGYGWHDVDYEAYDAAQLKWRKQRLMFDIVGYPLGTYLGHRLYADCQYAFGDALMLIVGRGVGVLYGFLLSDLLGLELSEENMGWRWLVTAGGVGGVIGMNRYIRGYDYSFGQAALMGLGSVAGGAFAVGLGVILEIEKSEYYDFGVIAGSLGGFYLTRRIINPRPEQASARGSGRQPEINLALQPSVIGGAVLPTIGIEARW